MIKTQRHFDRPVHGVGNAAGDDVAPRLWLSCDGRSLFGVYLAFPSGSERLSTFGNEGNEMSGRDDEAEAAVLDLPSDTPPRRATEPLQQ